jgi:alanyl-tRNA synthetase
MSEVAPEVTPEATAAPEAPEAEPKTFDAEYVEKIRREAAKYRTEAKANADAAKRLAEIEDAQKSESERAAERLREAEEKATALESQLIVAKVASESGVPVELLAGPADRTADGIKAYADLIHAYATKTKTTTGGRAPAQGRTPSNSGADPMREFTRGLFERASAD